MTAKPQEVATVSLRRVHIDRDHAAYEFELTHAHTHTTAHLTARYSALHTLNKAIIKHNLAKKLPPFPPKKPLNRHSPAFLNARGRALATHLQALLAHPVARHLAQPLLREAKCNASPLSPQPSRSQPAQLSMSSPTPELPPLPTPLTTATTTSSTATSTAFALSPPASSAFNPATSAIAITPATSAISDAPAASTFTSTISNIVKSSAAYNSLAASEAAVPRWLVSALAALLAALVAGLVGGQPLMSIFCCLLGIAGGGGVPGAAPGASLASLNGLGALSSVGPRRAEALQAEALRVEPPQVELVNAGPPQAEPSSIAAHESTPLSPLAAAALEAAKLGLDRLEKCAKFAAEGGWRAFGAREGVDIHVTESFTTPLHSSPLNGSVGTGVVNAAPDDVLRAITEPSVRHVVDNLWDATVQLCSVPAEEAAAAAPAGWIIESLVVEHSHFRPPAIVVAPRESIVAKVVARSSAGSIRIAFVSLPLASVAHIPVRRGHVRLDCVISGSAIDALGDASPPSSRMAFVSVLDPNGSVPKWVVRKTMPDRALMVARVRKAVVALAS